MHVFTAIQLKYVKFVMPSLLFLSYMLSHTEKNQRIHRRQRQNQENSVLSGFSKGRASISPNRDQFFTSKGLNKKQKACEQSLSKGDKNKNSIQVPPTDESSNYRPSIFQDSIQLLEKRQLNDQYFQPSPQPLVLKQKKLKLGLKKSPNAKKLEDISIKLSEMSKMVCLQEKEVHNMKSSVSKKELHRLVKMHSIEKLQLINQISRATSIKGRKHNEY